MHDMSWSVPAALDFLQVDPMRADAPMLPVSRRYPSLEPSISNSLGQQAFKHPLLHRSGLLRDSLGGLNGIIYAGEDFGNAVLFIYGREHDAKIEESGFRNILHGTAGSCSYPRQLRAKIG